jgi:type IV pilus assembly protein PilC
MPRYRYTGKNFEGQPVEGSANAVDVSGLESRLLNQGVCLESARPSLSGFRQQLMRRFKSAELTRITRQLQILLKSRIAVVDGLELVADQIKDRTLKSVFESIIGQVESGRTLAESFQDYPILFDELYTSMVKAGESSGQLDFAFDNIASYREKHEATARKVKSAMAYPLLVVVVAAMVVSALVLYVVPVFSSMYENFDAELPALTQLVVQVSNAVRDNLAYYVTAGVVMAVILVGLSLTRRSQYFFHTLIVRLPLLRNLTIKLITARFCRTMGTLLTSGVDILIALDIASKTTGNRYVSSRIEPAALQLVEGKSLTEALEKTNVFPKAVLRLSASGEKTGQLGEMLSRAADYYENETDSEITTLTTLIEPLIIIILGVFVAFILVAMYLPLFELVGTM